MSQHPVRLQWTRTTPDFELRTYSRNHTVTLKNGQSLGMSAATSYRGDAAMIDPEEAFVASLSSCHMLTFLAVAAGAGLVVDEYTDDAVGHLERIGPGKMAITRVVLTPRIVFAGDPPSADELDAMHDKAHGACFIANSVRTEVTIARPTDA